MKLTKQETSMVKVAAAYAAPHLIKKASLQQKLAAYGIGMSKQAETAGQAVLRHAGNAINRGLNRLGEMYDNNLTRAKEAQGLTPAQIHGPSAAEYQKGWEIYGPGPNRERGAMSSVPGSPLWEKTPEDYAADERHAKFERKANNRYKKRRAIWDAQDEQRQFKRQQGYFNEFMDEAKYAPTAEDRDMYLRRMRLLPPRNETDSLISNIWFPSSGN